MGVKGRLLLLYAKSRASLVEDTKEWVLTLGEGMHLCSAVNEREERIVNYGGKTAYVFHLDPELSHMRDSYGMNESGMN